MKSNIGNDHKALLHPSLEIITDEKPKIFFGWWTVLITGMVSGLGHGYYSYGFSIFFKDLAAELGINRATTSLAAGIGRLEGGITSPITGWLSDRFGPKWVIFSGTFLAGSGLVMMYFINSVWSYMVVWGVIIGVGLNIGLTISVDKALNDWFIRKRGLAQGTKFALIGIIGVILVPIVTWLVFYLGWRTTCLLWGLIILATTPLLLMSDRQKITESYRLLPDGEIAVSPSKFNSTTTAATKKSALISG